MKIKGVYWAYMSRSGL